MGPTYEALLGTVLSYGSCRAELDQSGEHCTPVRHSRHRPDPLRPRSMPASPYSTAVARRAQPRHVRRVPAARTIESIAAHPREDRLHELVLARAQPPSIPAPATSSDPTPTPTWQDSAGKRITRLFALTPLTAAQSWIADRHSVRHASRPRRPGARRVADSARNREARLPSLGIHLQDPPAGNLMKTDPHYRQAHWIFTPWTHYAYVAEREHRV
jgi:hypothetical protein